MIHLGKNTKSTIISKGISAGKSTNTYRGLVQVAKRATGAKNFTACDSLMMGSECSAITIPYIDSKNRKSSCNHEATTSKIDEDQLFYCQQRGLAEEDAINLLVSGFCKEVFQKLPMEFAVEANKLLEVSMEGSVG
jgi:Fe-S cluster assembly protein SufB